MINKFVFIVIFLTAISLTYLAGRSFRVNQIPNGNKFECNNCHVVPGGARNSFGLTVQANFLTSSGSSGNVEWGPELAALDSDGDGFTNGQELQDPDGTWSTGNTNPGDFSLVTNPGDPDDFPTSISDLTDIPEKFELINNYPNPFNPNTRITFKIAENSAVLLEIYNMLGEKVRTLVSGTYTPGIYSTIWNANDDFGYKVNSGIYIYRLVTDNFVDSKRMVLMK